MFLGAINARIDATYKVFAQAGGMPGRLHPEFLSEVYKKYTFIENNSRAIFCGFLRYLDAFALKNPEQLA